MGSLPPLAATITSSTSSSLLQPQAMPLISPSALLSAHLSQSPPRRPSGRTPLQSRPISLNTSSLTHAHGSSIIKIGNGTTVVCGVRGEILPLSDIPGWSVKDAITRTTDEWEAAEAADEETHTHGEASKRSLERDDRNENEDALWQHNLLVPNISLDTGCSPLHPANTAPSVEQQSISQRLLSLLVTSKLVRLRDLEIYQHHDTTPTSESSADADAMQLDDSTTQPSNAAASEQQPRTLKAFWTLYIDILCISHAGSASVFDAAWLALLAALRTTELPAAEWDADLGRVVCFAPSSQTGGSGEAKGRGVARATERRNAPRRLKLRGNPVPLGWGVFGVDQRVAVAAATALGKVGGENKERGPESASESLTKADTKTTATLLIDLDTAEEEVCPEQGCVVVDLDGSGETTLLRLEKSGGAAAGVGEIQQVVEAAEKRWQEWMGLVGGLGG